MKPFTGINTAVLLLNFQVVIRGEESFLKKPFAGSQNLCTFVARFTKERLFFEKRVLKK